MVRKGVQGPPKDFRSPQIFRSPIMDRRGVPPNLGPPKNFARGISLTSMRDLGTFPNLHTVLRVNRCIRLRERKAFLLFVFIFTLKLTGGSAPWTHDESDGPPK